MNALDDITRRLLAMSDGERQEVLEVASKAVAGMPWVPNPGPQTEAYFCPADELFYGGEAGGGKTDLLIGLSVTAHTISRLFRRQHKDRLALIDRMAEILGTRAGYNGQDHVWRIPDSDKVVRFGAMSNPGDWEDYQGDPTDLKAWDEITHFRREEYVTVNAWTRTVKKGQRTRVVAAGNPPVTADGLWVVEHWGPWLDEDHPRPAAPGELRYFATVDEQEDIEVDADWRGTGPQGQIILPKSRTFIPAGLTDNPDLEETGYGSTLMNLPRELRDALAYGRFRTRLQDADLQVIPTEWIIKAQQRWMVRKGEIEKTPMSALGVDVADGGKDRMVATPLHGAVFDEPRIKPGEEVRTTEQKVAFILSIARDDPQINVDCGGGYGGGVCDVLDSNNFHVVRCKGAEESKRMERTRTRRYFNKRAEYVYDLRDALDPESGENVALPPGREIVAELTCFREKRRPDMRETIQIEAQEDIVKRLGRSPDIGWSIIFAWAEHGKTRQKTKAATRRRSGAGLPRVNRQYDKVIGRRAK